MKKVGRLSRINATGIGAITTILDTVEMVATSDADESEKIRLIIGFISEKRKEINFKYKILIEKTW